jgi:hypothetical protein
MKNKRRSVLFIVLIIWICLLVLWFFLSEDVLNLVLPGFGGVEQWLFILLAGAIFITLFAVIALVVILYKTRIGAN